MACGTQDQQPKVLEQFVDLEENFMRNVDDNVNVYFEQMLTRTYESLDQPGDEQLVAKVKKFFEPGHIALMRECCNGQLAEPYAVVAHGDCWTNNFLFKYDEVIDCERRDGVCIDIRYMIIYYSFPPEGQPNRSSSFGLASFTLCITGHRHRLLHFCVHNETIA